MEEQERGLRKEQKRSSQGIQLRNLYRKKAHKEARVSGWSTGQKTSKTGKGAQNSKVPALFQRPARQQKEPK
eukprot:222929-Pelagomonas_calceolata.AAC.8